MMHPWDEQYIFTDPVNGTNVYMGFSCKNIIQSSHVDATGYEKNQMQEMKNWNKYFSSTQKNYPTYLMKVTKVATSLFRNS